MLGVGRNGVGGDGGSRVGGAGPPEVIGGKLNRELARLMREGWRVYRKSLNERRILLLRLNLPLVGGDTRHG